MSVINSAHLLAAAGGEYQIQRSVRLRSSASASFNRTTTGSGSNTTATISVWVKRGAITSAAQQVIFSSERFAGNDGLAFYFDTSDRLNILTNLSAGATSTQLITTQVFRDPSAWYHLVLAFDTSQATASNRVFMYVNGVQITAFSTATYPALNASIWLGTSGIVNYISRVASSATWFFDGYLAEYNVINGQQLTPSSFGYTDSNGIWQPKAYTGTYGTNGFYLKFTDNSAATATTIGKDYSGNGNNWTPNNISVTAGVTYDSMIDTPSYTATASNYAVLNPLIGAATGGASYTITQGNIYAVLSAVSTNVIEVPATMALPTTGKWYWEVNVVSVNTTYGYPLAIGISDQGGIGNGTSFVNNYYYYLSKSGNKYSNGTLTAYGATYTANDVIGVAFDAGAGTLTFYKNNVSQGTAFTGLTGTFYPKFASNDGSTFAVTFGQRPFTYTPPSGFAALNTYNLPAATINNGATVMAASTYTGTGATQSIVNSGNNAAAVSFKPDFVWVKSRSAATDHKLTDSVRGTTKALISDTTGAETTDANGLTAFGTNGFTLGTDTNYNNNTATYIGWQWQAGQGTTSSNTNGSITSTVSVNQSAGFSVVTYTGNGTNGATVGHGLGVIPAFVIMKSRSLTGSTPTSNWLCWHKSISQAIQTSTTIDLTGYTGATYLNLTVASSTYSFDAQINGSGQTYVAYCWSEVAGYSKFGSYTGNGSADGPFVYCGFRPRWIMLKATSGSSDWVIMDTSRDTYNLSINSLYADTSGAESAAVMSIDLLSNGFKYRSTALNGSGATYIYAAFAENPFNISRAR